VKIVTKKQWKFSKEMQIQLLLAKQSSRNKEETPKQMEE
jgi:hypothetical protein